tara:strand:- start:104 stop:412 length:309 start_codon:yes stop_codon:yes gene_type:complete
MIEQATVEGESRVMVRKEGTNVVSFPGLDYSNGSKPLLIVHETRRALVVKVPGGKHFAGMGWQASHPAEYMVLLKLPDGKVMEIISSPVRTSNEVVKAETDA